MASFRWEAFDDPCDGSGQVPLVRSPRAPRDCSASPHDDELREWVLKPRELDTEAPLTLVYFNDHFCGQAVHGARNLGQLLLGLD